MEVSAGKEFNF